MTTGTDVSLLAMPSATATSPPYTPQSLDRWLAEALPDSAPVEGELPLELTNAGAAAALPGRS